MSFSPLGRAIKLNLQPKKFAVFRYRLAAYQQ